jgi:rhomboid family GlyGly-CTERM serine protease
MTYGRAVSRKGLGVPLVIGVVCLAILALPDQGRAALGYDRTAVAAGQWWRLVTAHVSHLSVAHGLMNVAAIGLLGWLFRDDFDGYTWAGGYLVSALAIGLGLFWFWPDVGWYVGLSGILHGLGIAGGLVWLLGGERLAGGLLLAALALKLAYEAIGGPLPGTAAAAGGPVLVESHWLGALGGLAAGAAAGLRRRL